MKKRQRCLMIAFIIGSMMLALGQVMAGEAPPEVMDAARTGLPTYLAAIAGQEAAHGLSPENMNVSLDSPFELYRIDPDKLASFEAGDSVDKLLSKSGAWYFPLVVDGVYKSVLVVDKVKDQWEAVSIGYAPLARELGAVRASWPESKGYHPRLIVMFQASKHLFNVPESEADNLTVISVRSAAPTAPPPGQATRYGKVETDVGKVVQQLKMLAAAASPQM